MKFSKKLCIFTLTVVSAAGLMINASAHGSDEITDVSGHWAQDVMLDWQEDGFLTGDGDGNLDPDSEITRAEYLTLVNRMMDFEATSDSVSQYTDISTDAWYYTEVSKALAAGYITGTASDTMSPEALVSKQEAIVMLSRAAGLSTDAADQSILSQVSDASDIASWAKPAVAAAINSGYVVGSGGNLLPTDNLTRAEAVTLLNRLYADSRTLYFPGTYTLGTVSDVSISGADVTLANTSVTGDLTVSASVGSGSVTLDGVTVSGLLNQKSLDTQIVLQNGSTAAETRKPDKWADGTYTGSAYGYKSTIQVQVQVENGALSAINVVNHDEDKLYFNVADVVVDKMLAGSTTDVDTVSGATFSSRGIVNAVKNALKSSVTEKGYTVADALTGTYKDGTYVGIARGLYAGLHVTATIEDNQLVALTLGENNEDSPYVVQAAEGVISEILEQQSTDVDTVSSATYSSKGIINATKYALNLASENPVSEQEESRDGYTVFASYGGESMSDGDSWFYDVQEVDDGYVATGLTNVDGVSNALIVKYDTSGALVWKQLVPGYRFANIITTSEGLFLTGYYAVDPDTSTDGEDGEDTDAAAILLSADGQILWQKNYSSGSVTADGAASNDAFNQYWMWANNAVDMGNGTIVVGGMSNAADGVFGSALGDSNALLAVIDAATGELKTVQVFGSDSDDLIVSLAKTSDGDLIVIGGSAGENFTFQNGGWSDNTWDAKLFVMRVSADLDTVRWTKLYQTDWEPYQSSVVVDNEDNIYAAYSYKSGTDCVTLAKLDGDGSELWVKDYTYADEDYLSALTLGSDNQPLLVIESYDEEYTEKYGWLGSINSESGAVDWSFVFATSRGSLMFNAVQMSDGSILSAGIEQDSMGYYIADLIRYQP
ncbi:MAG: xylan-binding protein [Oscillospiraceae bacterium]|nr:xylan-binding protein [Oscillospiraceae bacterium]